MISFVNAGNVVSEAETTMKPQDDSNELLIPIPLPTHQMNTNSRNVLIPDITSAELQLDNSSASSVSSQLLVLNEIEIIDNEIEVEDDDDCLELHDSNAHFFFSIPDNM